jgi:hypothetical protein
MTVCVRQVPSILLHTSSLAVGSAMLLSNDVVAAQADCGSYVQCTAANYCDG